MARTAPMALDDQLCFALHAASRAMTARYRALLAPLGLTYPQYLVLLALWGRADDPTVSQLGDTLRLDSGTLSPLLTRLEAAGLVTRVRRPGDERAVHISLTDDGRTMRARASHVPRHILAAVGGEAADLRDRLWELEARLRG